MFRKQLYYNKVIFTNLHHMLEKQIEQPLQCCSQNMNSYDEIHQDYVSSGGQVFPNHKASSLFQQTDYFCRRGLGCLYVSGCCRLHLSMQLFHERGDHAEFHKKQEFKINVILDISLCFRVLQASIIYQCSFFMSVGVMLNFTKSTCLR